MVVIYSAKGGQVPREAQLLLNFGIESIDQKSNSCPRQGLIDCCQPIMNPSSYLRPAFGLAKRVKVSPGHRQQTKRACNIDTLQRSHLRIRLHHLSVGHIEDDSHGMLNRRRHWSVIARARRTLMSSCRKQRQSKTPTPSISRPSGPPLPGTPFNPPSHRQIPATPTQAN